MHYIFEQLLLSQYITVFKNSYHINVHCISSTDLNVVVGLQLFCWIHNSVLTFTRQEAHESSIVTCHTIDYRSHWQSIVVQIEDVTTLLPAQMPLDSYENRHLANIFDIVPLHGSPQLCFLILRFLYFLIRKPTILIILLFIIRLNLI